MASLRAVLGFCTAIATVACFDSDEKFKSADTTTTGTTLDPTTGVDPSTSSGSSSTGDIAPGTCRDGIACIQQCTIDLITMMEIEPDLGCFLDCIETMLSIQEAKKLLELSNCVSELCKDEMACETPDDTTSTGGSSDSGSGSSSSTGEPDPPPGLLGPCLTCVFSKLPLSEDDEGLQGCEEFAMECK